MHNGTYLRHPWHRIARSLARVVVETSALPPWLCSPCSSFRDRSLLLPPRLVALTFFFSHHESHFIAVDSWTTRRTHGRITRAKCSRSRIDGFLFRGHTPKLLNYLHEIYEILNNSFLDNYQRYEVIVDSMEDSLMRVGMISVDC